MQESNEIKKQQSTLNEMSCDEFKDILIRKIYELHNLRPKIHELLDQESLKVQDDVDYQKSYIERLASCRALLYPYLQTEALLLAARTISDSDYLKNWFQEANYTDEFLNKLIENSWEEVDSQ